MKIFSMTDVGRKREMNQDYVFATDESLGTLPMEWVDTRQAILRQNIRWKF